MIGSPGASGMKRKTVMNRFASAFLMPAAHVREEAGRQRGGITVQEIFQLKRLYGVPAAAMLTRLKQVGVLPKDVVQYAFRTYAAPWRTTEPEPLEDGCGYAGLERPEHFERLVWRALGERLLQPLRAAKMLGQPLDVAERGIRGG